MFKIIILKMRSCLRRVTAARAYTLQVVTPMKHNITITLQCHKRLEC